MYLRGVSTPPKFGSELPGPKGPGFGSLDESPGFSARYDKPLEIVLGQIGYVYKGEFNIPFHSGFSKPGVNLHVYPPENPEIELNLHFRDYLRAHPEAVEEYAALKKQLVSQPASHQKQGRFTGYNLGKDAFIKKILGLSGFNGLCIRYCTHHDEWAAAKAFSNSGCVEKIEDFSPIGNSALESGGGGLSAPVLSTQRPFTLSSTKDLRSLGTHLSSLFSSIQPIAVWLLIFELSAIA